MNYDFSSENNYVILGANGSGKSTLLQVIAGNLTNSEGEIEFKVQSSKVEEDTIYKQLSYCAPYLDLFEEFTLTESIEFQEKFKPFQSGLSTKQIIVHSSIKFIVKAFMIFDFN